MSDNAYTTGKNLFEFGENFNLGFDSIDPGAGDGDSNLINVTDLRENISEIRNSFEDFSRDISGIGNQGFDLDELFTNAREVVNELPIFDLSDPIAEQSPLESPEITETQGSPTLGNDTSISGSSDLLAQQIEFNETVGFQDLLTDISSAPIGIG